MPARGPAVRRPSSSACLSRWPAPLSPSHSAPTSCPVPPRRALWTPSADSSAACPHSTLHPPTNTQNVSRNARNMLHLVRSCKILTRCLQDSYKMLARFLQDACKILTRCLQCSYKMLARSLQDACKKSIYSQPVQLQRIEQSL